MFFNIYFNSRNKNNSLEKQDLKKGSINQAFVESNASL